MQTIDKITKSFKNILQGIYPENEIQAIIELVFEHLFNFSKIDLILKANEPIDETGISMIEPILKRLKEHEPIQYIIGQSYFYNGIYYVDKNVLIPRQETEELVDWIISENKNTGNLNILDIGTGSGCIAISLSLNLKGAKVYAIDISTEALELAKKNAIRNHAEVQFIQKDILSNQYKDNQQFDLIVSNPPYVLNKEKGEMQKNVLDYEPKLALFVNDDDPLIFYNAITNFSAVNLKLNGRLYFEINEAYGKQVASLMERSGFGDVVIKKDINGKNRMVSGKK